MNRTELAAIATRLNDAVFAARRIGQNTIATEIDTALSSTVELLVGGESPIHADVVRQALRDGSSVAEALDAAYCGISAEEAIQDLLQPVYL